MEQKVIQNEQIKAAGFLQALLEFGVVLRLLDDKTFQQVFAVEVATPVFRAGNNANRLGQIGLSAVRWTEDANIQAALQKSES